MVTISTLALFSIPISQTTSKSPSLKTGHEPEYPPLYGWRLARLLIIMAVALAYFIKEWVLSE